MNYCSLCGNATRQGIPKGDNRERMICDTCHVVHYVNPKIVTGILPIWKDKVLLCKRAIKPRYGLWTLPAGFMENGESLSEGALRESREEANTTISNDTLYVVSSLPAINQVYVMYRGDLVNQDFSAGRESLEVKLFAENEIPWDELAFQVIKKTLQFYFNDRKQGHYPVHSIILESNDQCR